MKKGLYLIFIMSIFLLSYSASDEDKKLNPIVLKGKLQLNKERLKLKSFEFKTTENKSYPSNKLKQSIDYVENKQKLADTVFKKEYLNVLVGSNYYFNLDYNYKKNSNLIFKFKNFEDWDRDSEFRDIKFNFNNSTDGDYFWNINFSYFFLKKLDKKISSYQSENFLYAMDNKLRFSMNLVSNDYDSYRNTGINLTSLLYKSKLYGMDFKYGLELVNNKNIFDDEDNLYLNLNLTKKIDLQENGFLKVKIGGLFGEDNYIDSNITYLLNSDEWILTLSGGKKVFTPIDFSKKIDEKSVFMDITDFAETNYYGINFEKQLSNKKVGFSFENQLDDSYFVKYDGFARKLFRVTDVNRKIFNIFMEKDFKELKFNFNLSYIDSSSKLGKEDIRKVRSSIKLSFKNIKFNPKIEYEFLGKADTDTVKMDSGNLFNINFSKNIKNNLDVLLKLENVFDSDVEIYPNVKYPRTISIGIKKIF